MPGGYNVLQSSFATGVISEEVAARLDVQKIQSALLTADNVIIRPYGSFYKRMGLLFTGAAKFPDKTCIFQKFNVDDTTCYLLEIGEGYIRIWLRGAYQNVELATPYGEGDLSNLRFCQSADVLFVASGSYPLKVLTRYSDGWTFADYPINIMPFMPVNPDEAATVTPSGTLGNITLTASKAVFTAGMAGTQIKLDYSMPAQSVTASGQAVLVGSSWRVLTSGTWTGTIALERSLDGVAWEAFRMYQSTNSFNANDNGTVDEPTFLRMVLSISSGTATATLTALPFVSSGIARITAVGSATQAAATVIKRLGNTTATDIWYLGAWSDDYGYPKCVSFFQDRLALAGSKKQQNGVWFSRTGDYPNFDVETAEGKLTDDSALSFNILAREFFDIRHIVPSTDFLMFTSGNEWKMSGSSAVTPTNINTQIQTSWGTGHTEPVLIGNRIVYIQRRGAKVRDMGYSFESDNYTGDDLTIYVQHLTEGYSFVDCAYTQQPDSLIYFARSDGKLLVLTYMREQSVFAWSVIETDGKIESVISVPEGENDIVYVLAAREVNGETVRYIERFALDAETDNPADYTMLDAAKVFDAPGKTLTGLDHLAGRGVKVVGDGKLFPNPDGFTVGADGSLVLPWECAKVVVGLPYRLKVDFIDIIADIKGSGSTFGKARGLGKARLKLKNSFGGKVYASSEAVANDIFAARLAGRDVFTEELNVKLYSGNEELLVPNERGTNAACGIIHDEPYPFKVSAISREVLVSVT